MVSRPSKTRHLCRFTETPRRAAVTSLRGPGLGYRVNHSIGTKTGSRESFEITFGDRITRRKSGENKFFTMATV